ncbi:zinc-binding dehydrogenase [uncultured Desulfobacter sp.]|uniref:zinc-binding dehydrogenase n=1 Tax=uncultured Desulfobacter sp. TaxID=240139 RepID=UPI0029C5FCB6|nr:zinc-binding dehydrogenase [uncultured Desulfobacter sp.]
MEEEKHLLKNLSNFNTFYWGDHSNNIVSSRGRLPDNRQAFLKKIENAIATHPVTRQKVLTTMANSFEAAALNGQVASTVAMVELDLSLAHFKGLSLHVVFMLIPMIHNYQREAHAEILGRLADIVDAGGLQPVLDEQRFSLEEVGKAHDRFSSGQAMGKIVVEV